LKTRKLGKGDNIFVKRDEQVDVEINTAKGEHSNEQTQ
jgi:hypothetical protein